MPSCIPAALLLTALLSIAATAPSASMAGQVELRIAAALRWTVPPIGSARRQVDAPGTAPATADPAKAESRPMVIPFGTSWG